MEFGKQFSMGTIYQRDDFLQINFASKGCNLKKEGRCHFCNFPGSRPVTLNEVKELLYSSLILNSGANEILYGVQGSIFDKEEFSREILDYIIYESIFKLPIQVIGFETHYTFVNKYLLTKICNLLSDCNSNKEIYIEMGLESADKKIIEQINKKMDLEGLKRKVKQIQFFKFDTILNILYGFPNLTEKENEDSLLKTINFVLSTGSVAIIFPYNAIKKDEKSASILKLLIILSNLSDDELKYIQIAWYGDRQYVGLNLDHRLPDDLNIRIFEFIRMYNKYKGNRKELLNKFLKS